MFDVYETKVRITADNDKEAERVRAELQFIFWMKQPEFIMTAM